MSEIEFDIDVTVGDGKYRYARTRHGDVYVFRHGEPWEARQADIIGDKFVYCLAAELQEARTELFDQGTELLYLRERVAELEAREELDG